MKVRTGLDIVRVDRFRASNTEIISAKAFLPLELTRKNPEHLAGIFAAKEAVMKALNIPAGNWRNIEITHEENGRPKIRLSPGLINTEVISSDLSISHDGEYAIAVAVFLIHTDQHG